MSDEAVMLMTTVENADQAESLAAVLLEERLAACIQELPITSRYRWQGELQRDSEVLLLIKTSANAADAAVHVIERHHDYDTPEIVAVPITAGLPAYLQWIHDETRAAD